MQIVIHDTKRGLGAAAAGEGAAAIAATLAREGHANIILATGASQFEMLDVLVRQDLDWSRVTAFHLDEYVGLPADHPASFRRYLRERVLDRIRALGEFVMVEGDAADIGAEVARLNARIRDREICVCFAGIGENCHLAFNDPPADFDTTAPYLLVDLDDACRRQQASEGWFASLEAVPRQAISISIRQIMKSARVVLAVSDTRKAEAVRHALEGPVTPRYPASILQQHPATTIHLDHAAAALLANRG
jgi:glucosamine-6-phosphate deaminase